MTLKPSLSIRLLFFAVMLLMGFLLSAFFSGMTLKYFEHGLDMSIRESMINVAREAYPVEVGHPIKSIGFDVAAEWQDLPQEVRKHIQVQPEEDNLLNKYRVGGNIFTFERPEKFIVVVRVNFPEGQSLYVSKILEPDIKLELSRRKSLFHPVWILVSGMSAMLIFSVVIVLFVKKVTKPVESLKDWAKSLDESKLKAPVPDFKFKELNTLGGIIHSSLDKVQESVEREQQFLSHASHELRTPIAVTRTNSELLFKVMEKEGASDKQVKILQRIERANKTMTNLTDTLLWLSRDERNLPESEPLELSRLVISLTDDLTYLLENKGVDLSVETEPHTILAANIPCQIVLINLIRNAFQHTMEGSVLISQKKNRVLITNTSCDNSIDTSDLGFGLGLKLTKKLADKYRWQYRDQIKEFRYEAEIIF